jgi:hypothetical protein
MNIEITPDIIIRYGDPIAISYSNGIGAGLFITHERSIQYYCFMHSLHSPNGLGKYHNAAWINTYMRELSERTREPRKAYIYGDHVMSRVVPLDIEIYKGTELYKEYEITKEIIHEHQNYWAANEIL